MSITSVILKKVKTTSFYDIATQVKEQEVDRNLYDGEYCSVQNLLRDVSYSNVRITMGTTTFDKYKGALVIDKETGRQKSFDNPADFDSWKKSVSLSELINCIIEIQFATGTGEGTERYCFEPSDMELSSKKRIKLYDFKVLEKSSEIIIPEASFEETNCFRGLEKIEKILNEGFRLSPYTCTVLLNGIDITEYFSDQLSVSMRTLKKEERGSAHFRYIHRGLNERIQHLKQSKGFISHILEDEPQKVETALADINKQIYELQEQLRAIGK